MNLETNTPDRAERIRKTVFGTIYYGIGESSIQNRKPGLFLRLNKIPKTDRCRLYYGVSAARKNLYHHRQSEFLRALYDSLERVFSSAACKSIRKRLERRNKFGIGLIGPVVDYQDGDEGKIAFSKRGVSKNNTKRRTKISLARFLARNHNGLGLTDENLEKVQNAFRPIRFELLSGEAANDVYENGPIKSCTKGKPYNKHLFLSNPDNLFLLVAKIGNRPVARAKIYKNDDGTHFLSRVYTDGSRICDLVELHFSRNFTSGELDCTLYHSTGEHMPYFDELKAGYGIDRVDSLTIRIYNEGDYTDTDTSGDDITLGEKCHQCRCREHDLTHIGDEDYCSDCVSEHFRMVNDEWYSSKICAYSGVYDDYVLRDECRYVYTSKNNEDWVLDEDAVTTHSNKIIYMGAAIKLHDGQFCAEWEDHSKLANGEYALDEDVTEVDGEFYLNEECVEYECDYYHMDDCEEVLGELIPREFLEDLEGVWVLKSELSELCLA